MKVFLLLCMTIILNATDTYDEAMQYLDGKKGAIEEQRLMPRCPYERCNGKTIYIHIEKDLKKGYELLKKAHNEGDSRASFKALEILLKQIDYKSKNYDSYLVEKLQKNYNLSVEQYNRDVVLYLNALVKSGVREYQCKGSFGLYEASTKKHFGISDNKIAKINRKIALASCDINSFDYFKLTNTGKNDE